MVNKVFANGREISCKKANGKSLCEFPDVCMTPPENPVTPPGVPVPYPNTSKAKDSSSGSKDVSISNGEVMLRNKSFFKTSSGDEAGSAAKKGIISSTNKGKAYFMMWSMDVKVSSENVVRHMDSMTHNHASMIGTGSVPMLYQDEMYLQAMEAWGSAFENCECCGGIAHSQAQSGGNKISENDFYGLNDFRCPNGVKIPSLNKGQQSFLKQARNECPQLFSEDEDCGGYYVITRSEKKAIDRHFKDKKSYLQSKMGAVSGETLHHRVPRAAGGCPVGVGNLKKDSDLTQNCRKRDKTLQTYQHKRSEALKKCL